MKHLRRAVTVFIVLLTTTGSTIMSQNKTFVKDRYIEIEDINSFFTFTNNEYSDLVSFELYNIMENESSKPVHTAVNEIKNVHKFTIKSNSQAYENQRTCFLSVKKINHLNTLRQVLLKMKVSFIKTSEGYIEINKYFTEIL